MSKSFAIADLHGRHDLLLMAIERIETGNPVGGKIVFTGDYVDRGPQSRQIIETLMAGPRDPERWRWVCLQGNHESMMLDCLAWPHKAEWWIGNGGGATLLSYGLLDTDTVLEAFARVPDDHRKWLSELPLYHEDEFRVFVHASVDETRELEDHTDILLQWTCRGRDWDHGYRGKHVVHGHEQFADGPLLYANRSDLDTLAWQTGRLVIGVFDDAVAGGPKSVIEVRGEPA